MHPRADQVAVVIPLHERDVVVGQHGRDAVEDVRVSLGVRDVQHLLVAPRRRQHAGTRPEHPVGVGPVEVGVRVDHLGLEPETELHAERSDVLDQRGEAVRPHGVVDVPVTETRAVVAAVAEPAVVEHEAFDTHRGGGVGQRRQPREVVIEVDGFPRVEHDGARTQRALAQLTVEGRADAVDALGGVGRVQPRRLVGLARFEHDLARQQQFAATQDGRRVGEVLRVRHVVAAPRHVQCPYLTGAEREPRRPGEQPDGRVGPGAAAAVLADPGAVVERVPLRRTLASPAAGEVEQLGGVGGRRKRGLQPLQRIRRRAVVAHGVPQPEHPGRCQFHHTGHGQLGRRIRRHVTEDRVLDRERRHRQRGREVLTAAMPAQSGATGVPGARVRQQRELDRVVGRAVGDDPRHRVGQGAQGILADVAERASPVRDDRQACAADVDHDAGGGVVQVHDLRAVHAGPVHIKHK